MTISAGTRLGAYELTGRLGAGGMGEVWQARDPRLGRDIAIKVLPHEFSDDPDRLVRFDREARLLASMNHPRIAAVYEVGSAVLSANELGVVPTSEARSHPVDEDSSAAARSDGAVRAGSGTPSDGSGRVTIHYIVMELAAGTTLASRLEKGPIPVDGALGIARQVAEALEAAHEKGIVHRDLKPGNVMVDDEGNVKVLDFGLAMMLETSDTSTSVGAEEPTVKIDPAIARAMTREGAILGTAAYMSPEQARGRRVDARADIWAFGVVVFEMLSGRRLFRGETASDTLVAVLTHEIDWSALPRSTPGGVRRMLARCLQRDPKRRLRDIGDARLELEEAMGSSRSDPTASFIPARRARSRARWLLACALCVVVGAVSALLLRTSHSTPAHASGVRFSIRGPDGATAPSNAISMIRISRDGRRIVYWDTSKPRLVFRDLSAFGSRYLPGTEGGSLPFLSPDGEWVGFYADGKIRKVAVGGGDPIAICDSPPTSPGADWGPDGTILFSPVWISGLWKVPATGGKPVPVTTPDKSKGEAGHFWPRFLPDGKHALFTVFGGRGLVDAKVAILDLSTGQTRTLFPGSLAQYVATGEIVYFHLGSYHAVPVDRKTLDVRGGERPVLPFVRHLDSLGAPECFVDFADGGRLAFVPGFGPGVVQLNHLVWIDRAGHRTQTGFAGFQAEPALSPDQHHAAIVRAEKGEAQIWIYDLDRGTSEQLTREGENVHPAWSPTGDRLAFSTMIHGNADLRWCPSDGSAPPRFLVESDQDEGHWHWLPDGRTGVFERYSPSTGKDILMMEEGHSDTARTIVSSPLDDQRPAPSPDGGMLAYSEGDTLYVARLPDMKSRTQIAVGAGFPAWSARSGELFYEKDETLFAIRCRLEGGRIVIGAPAALFDLPRSGRIRTFDVTADGSRFLFTENNPSEEVPEEVRLIEDGLGELTRAADPPPR